MKLDGFYETSAKNGKNVESAFIEAAKKLYFKSSGDKEDYQLTTVFKKNTDPAPLKTTNSTKLNKELHEKKAEDEQRGKKKKK
mmetsp:Transcript_8306/g.9423  ORF Transcript_8306/g.9423 Transcript_8306/m.9423 type:complete len:83 (+) Transcript_8306:489-737(+)